MTSTEFVFFKLPIFQQRPMKRQVLSYQFLNHSMLYANKLMENLICSNSNELLLKKDLVDICRRENHKI